MFGYGEIKLCGIKPLHFAKSVGDMISNLNRSGGSISVSHLKIFYKCMPVLFMLLSFIVYMV